MKLSELSTDRALDVLCELTPYIANIASDEAVVSAVGKVVDANKEINIYGKALLLAERMGEIIPALFKDHRLDVYGVLSIMNERPASEIAAQKITDTILQVRELFQDPELLSFFKSFAQQGQTEPSAHSAASPA